MDNKSRRTCVSKIDILFPEDISKNLETDLRIILNSNAPIIEITINERQFYLKDRARIAFRELFKVLVSSFEAKSVINDDIYVELKYVYAHFLSISTKPSVDAFLKRLEVNLESIKKNLNFLIPIEGIELEDDLDLMIGDIVINKKNAKFMDQFEIEKDHLKDSLIKTYDSHKYWAKVSVYGSENYVDSLVVYRVQHYLSIFLIHITSCYITGFMNSRVRILLDNMDGYSLRKKLSWEDGLPKSIGYRVTFGTLSTLKIDHTMIDVFKESAFSILLPSIIDKIDKNEIESAICRCLYWFGEAYKEPVLGMKFLKLWSCIECFFSIDKKQVTAANALGVATVLKVLENIDTDLPAITIQFSDYKKNAEKFYDLRSDIIHNANYSHIQVDDVEQLSKWVVKVLYVMLFYVSEKLITLSEVKKRIEASAKKYAN